MAKEKRHQCPYPVLSTACYNVDLLAMYGHWYNNDVTLGVTLIHRNYFMSRIRNLVKSL